MFQTDFGVEFFSSLLVPTKEVEEWNLPTEPWVFVVSEEGHVLARFEGLVSSEEVEAAIRKALG